VRRRLRAAVALLLVVAALTACGSEEAAACGADGIGPITFATVKNLTADQRAELKRRWQAGHPEEPLDIVVLPATSDEQRAQLGATLQVGKRGGAGRRDGYDVVGLDVVFLAEFARSNLLLDLPATRFEDADFLKAPWDNSFYEKRLYAVPFTTNVGLLYYWADRLVELGVIPNAETRWTPADWQEVRNVAQDSRDVAKPGPAGYTGQLAAYEGLTANALELIWAEGGDLPTAGEEPEPALLDGVARGVGFLLDGVRSRWIDESALGFDEEDSLNAFARRRVLMLRHWPDAWTTLSGSKEPVGVTRLPGSQSAVLGGESVAVAKCSPYRESAQRFIEFLSTTDQQKWIFETGLYLPAVQRLYTDGKSMTGERGLDPKFVELLYESVNQARGRPADPAWNQTSRTVQTVLHDALERSAKETVDADDVVSDLADRLER
jgi:multiple sugar transport system substrate-binding protein